MDVHIIYFVDRLGPSNGGMDVHIIYFIHIYDTENGICCGQVIFITITITLV